MGGGMAPPMAMTVPPELLRYKVPLGCVCFGYLTVLVLGIIAGNFSNVVNFIFVLIPALLMATRADQCMVQCLCPFMLFAIMAAFFDIITLVSALTNKQVGAQYFFAQHCPFGIMVKFTSNTTVYTQPDATPYTIIAGTQAEAMQDPCGFQWLIGNVGLLLGLFLDLVSSFMGCRMFKDARALVPAGDEAANAPMMGGMGGMGGFGGNPGPGAAPGGAPAGPPGGGRPVGGPGQSQGGFVPFRGGGQTLGN